HAFPLLRLIAKPSLSASGEEGKQEGTDHKPRSQVAPAMEWSHGPPVGEQWPSIVPFCVPVVVSGIRSIGRKGKFPIPRLTPRLTGPNQAGSALVYGWKLHVVSVVAAVWFPIAAVLTPANVANSEPALLIVSHLHLPGAC